MDKIKLELSAGFSARPFQTDWNSLENQRDTQRLYKLVKEALGRVETIPWEWSVGEPPKHGYSAYALERDGQVWVVYGEERGEKVPAAIFPNSHSAADYFVWLVSQGTERINWSLFIDEV